MTTSKFMVNKITKKILYIKAIVNKYLLKDTKYFFIYSARYFQKNYRHSCHFYEKNDLVSILQKGKSIIRLGDGEINFIHFLEIPYQRYKKKLRTDILRIIENYNPESNYVLSIPVYVNYSNKELRYKTNNSVFNYFRLWMPLKITYETNFNQSMTYLDSHIFYKNNMFSNIIIPYIKTKKVIFVTNPLNRAGIEKTNINSFVYKFINCSDENSYSQKTKIQKEITTTIEKSGYEKKDFVILFSAGLLKVVIENLSNLGYQSIDIGKGIEAFYNNTSLEKLI